MVERDASQYPDVQIRGRVERLDSRSLIGWAAAESEDGFRQTSVSVAIDGVDCGEFPADGARKDLVNRGIGDGRHGFRIAVPDRFCDGAEHEVVVTAVDASVRQPLRGSPLTARIDSGTGVTENARSQPPRFEGRIDRVDERGIRGWAWNEHEPASHIEVEILVDSEVVDRCVANIYREDLARAGKGAGDHGFRVPLPHQLSDGSQHRINACIAGSDTRLAEADQTYAATTEREYASYEQFSAWALLNRVLHYPLREEDRRVLAYMDWFKERLVSRYRAQPASVRVSIILPVFNRAAVVRTAVASVLQQTYASWELLLIDDGSTDASVDILRTFENDDRIHVIALEENRGVSHARNVGLSRASGELIAYLDSDNTMDPDFLMVMVNALAGSREFDCAYCAQLATEVHQSPLHGQIETHFIRYGPFNRSLLENRNYLDLNAFVHRASMVDSRGPFDEDLRRLVDWDLLLRYTEDACPLAVPAVLSQYYYGTTDNQITSTERLSEAESRLAERRHQYGFALADLPTLRSYPGGSDYMPRHLASQTRPRTTTDVVPLSDVTIVIPSFEASEYLDYCVSSVAAFTDTESVRVLIVDNASSAHTVALIRALVDRYEFVEARYNHRNLGFTYACNQGIRAAAPGSDVVLLNNDAVVTMGWLEALQQVVRDVPDVGVAVPRQTLFPGTATADDHVPYAATHREVDVSLSKHHNNVIDPALDPVRGYIELSFAPFFCAYITRECLTTTGLLNARGGRHYRSDRLYCDVVRMIARKRIVYTPHSKLYHFLQQSTSELKLDADSYRRIFVDNAWSQAEELEFFVREGVAGDLRK